MIGKADTALATALHPSPNFGVRCGINQPNMLLLHYTGVEAAAKAIDWLSRPESRVSAHYVIDEAGRITQLVAESMRAWHAGIAVWAAETDINSASVGIEIHNPGHELGYREFPEPQLRALEALAKHYEHRERNYAMALEMTRTALEVEDRPEIRRRAREEAVFVRRDAGPR